MGSWVARLLGGWVMNLVSKSLIVIAVGMSAIVPIGAQWPSYPSPAVPKTADGKPDLKGPVPRTGDGHPDFSGVWAYTRRAGLPPPGRPGALGQGMTGQFWDIGTGMSDPIPFQPWAKAVLDKRMADHSKDNPDAHCLPLGIMQLHTHPDPHRIVQTPGLTVMLWEANTGVRYIYTDGRPLPNNDPQPWYFGYSVGRWEADTLVVETIGLRDDGWLDVNGTPSTTAAKITERFRRPVFGTMTVDVTVDDPKAYTKPWSVSIEHRLLLNTDLMEFVCQENEKSSQHF